MYKSSQTLVVILLANLVVAGSGCKLLGGSDSSGDGTTSTSGGTFTASDIIKAWTQSCTAGSEPISGGTYFRRSVTLNVGGNYNSYQDWYTNSSCSASPVVRFAVTGIYTVGGVISASSSLQSIQFTVTTAQMAATGNAVRTAYNTNCGGTSPYNAGANATDGTFVNSNTMLCASMTFPNTTGAKSIINNVASYSNATLTMGTPATGIPGVFSDAATPTTAGITLN